MVDLGLVRELKAANSQCIAMLGDTLVSKDLQYLKIKEQRTQETKGHFPHLHVGQTPVRDMLHELNEELLEAHKFHPLEICICVNPGKK